MTEKQNIYQKLNNFRGLVGAIRKDKENPYHKSKYVDINTILEATTDKLSEAGLVDVDTTKIDENGQLWLETKLINIDNPEEFLKIETPLLLKDKNNPQALGSALTYCRRYNRVTLLGLEQEDDDGNAAAKAPKEHYPTPNIKQKKLELSNYLKTHNIIGDAQKAFVQYLKSKNHDVEDFKQLNQLLQNKNLLNKLIDEYISIEANKAM